MLLVRLIPNILLPPSIGFYRWQYQGTSYRLVFQLLPSILDRVEVRALKRPSGDYNSIIYEPLADFINSIDSCVVLHKCVDSTAKFDIV